MLLLLILVGGVIAIAHSATSPWVAWTLTLFAAGSIVAVLFIVRERDRAFTKTLKQFVSAARDITHGRNRRRISSQISTPFADLAAAFDQMVDARIEAEERLRRAHESLEFKVHARTVELYRANKALKEESEQRIHAEREFHQAQKMDALGKLAGSIAHDFNNLLTVIIGGVECVRKQLGEGHPDSELLQVVQQAGERAAGLTRPLLTFSRNQVTTAEALSLNDAVKEAAGMLGRLLGINIELRQQLDSQLPLIKGSATQVQQVIMNLAVNARDAMNGMGILTVTTRKTVRATADHEESFVELSVSDTGSGMDEATKARIFEPFFTTKPAGRGTGLGLSTVFGIVKQMGGTLEVDSALGQGTTFRIVFPATQAIEEETKEFIDAPQETTGACDETILLVEDEEDIRWLTILNLENQGYTVLAASSGDEAIVLAETHNKEIDLLITDVQMPGINGVQLAELLSRQIPGLRVLFVSGHSNDTLSEEVLRSTNARYLQKPYLSDALLSAVQSSLSGMTVAA